MTSKKKHPADAAPAEDTTGSPQAGSLRQSSVQAGPALRQRAEAIAREKAAQSPESLDAMSPLATRQMLHELRVHQIELETQNEELRRARVELDASQARYFDLYDLAPVGYCIVTEAGLILQANLTAATLLGVARVAQVKQQISRFILKEDVDKYYLLRKQLIETGEPLSCELRMVRSGGPPFWAHLAATTAQDEGGAPVLRIVLSDISERKLAEQRILAGTAELERSNEELAQFAYVASHDLQEPLRMVSNYAELLARRYRGRLDAEADEFIGFMVEGAARMHQLINDLLAYSRLDTKEGQLAPVDFGAALDQALGLLQAAIEESGAVVTHGPLPTLMADETRVVQLLQNLVGNAVKFRRELPPRVHVEAESRGKEWMFTVRDNGIGIDPKHAERIFAIFQRLHGRDDYPGTGIGLAICRKIVQRHGGRIWVESRPGVGSVFRFTLPAGSEVHP